MINKSTNIAEILESIDSIVSNGEYDNYSKRKIINKRKEFSKKKIDMKFNRDAEKIIIEAEKAHDDKKSLEPLILNNQKKDDVFEKSLILNKTRDEAESNADRNALSRNFEKPLILLNEFKEDNMGVTEGKNLEDENNIQELDSNLAYEIKRLKNSNTEQDEKIKDLNILLNKFKSKERYSDLDKAIKIYQTDNAVLRKKILRHEDTETDLRLKLVEIHHDKSIKNKQGDKIENSSVVQNEKINQLNNEILLLVEQNKTFQVEIENLKKDKDINFKNIENKIQFYREENAKIIIDRSEIQKKLENVKSQLLINEQNKKELKLTLDKLNQILASSNIKTIF
jgi:hypothetical protein